MTSGFPSFHHGGAKSCAITVGALKPAARLVWHVLAAAEAATSSAGEQTMGENDEGGNPFGRENAELSRKAAVAPLLFFFSFWARTEMSV